MNHVSVSPTDGNGPTQGQRKTLIRVGIDFNIFTCNANVIFFGAFFYFLQRLREVLCPCVKSRRLKMLIDFTSLRREFLGLVKTNVQIVKIERSQYLKT